MRELTGLLWAALMLPLNAAYGQDGPPSTEAEYQAAYEQRIKQRELYGVYIPVDLAEAFAQLNKLTDVSSKQVFRSTEEIEAVRQYFNSFGRWIIHNWGFYGGSRYSHYLKATGLSHPEDMAVFTMIMWHRHLNQKALDPKPVIEDILDRRRRKLESRYLQGEVIEERVIAKPAGGGY